MFQGRRASLRLELTLTHCMLRKQLMYVHPNYGTTYTQTLLNLTAQMWKTTALAVVRRLTSPDCSSYESRALGTPVHHDENSQTSKPDQLNPTARIAAALVFRSKATVLQIRRAVHEFTRNNVKQAPFGNRLIGHPIIAESRTPLRMTDDEVENLFISGKIHNLRLATRKLNGLELGAGDVFSFWTQLGRTSRWKGYVPGRELREGCLILTIGGGLCQLSNALYDAALQAGLQIVERHAHTRVIAGSLAEIGRDATVFWNYVDLRFRSIMRFVSKRN